MKKRWTLKITLALLAGAVVTWAVAWGCALWCLRPRFTSAPIAPWPSDAPEAWGQPEVVTISESWGSAEILYIQLHPRLRQVTRLEAGAPCRALGAWTIDEPVDIYKRVGWLAPPEWTRPRDDRELPARILPLGFTLNTLLAAGALLGVTEGAGAWRRRSRRSKGKCPWCGYDRAGVAGDAPCPECGRVAR